MPQKQTKKLALYHRRQKVADLALQGWAQAAIAGELGVSQGTVSSDLNAIREQWKKAALRDFDQARGIELQKLDLLEREAWAAWKRSQTNQQSAVITGEGPGKTRKSVANRYGDPRFLEQVNKCVAQRRALLGLDIAPVASPTEDPFDGSVTVEVRRERLAAIVTAISHRGGAPHPGAGTEHRQPGDVRPLDQPGTLETGEAP